MKTRKIIKLINNERMNGKVSVNKACDSSSVDICSEYDEGICTIGSYDVCIKDFMGCTQNSNDYACSRDYASCANRATDYCSGTIDYTGCITSGAIDY